MKAEKNLIHDEPAMRWEDAIPLGNGFLGAMVYGHTGREKIQLNEDSLWYGKGEDRLNPAALSRLKEVQQLILNREFAKAEEILFSGMISSPPNMRNYSTLGELDIALNQKVAFPMGWFPESDGDNYVSDLDLESGVLHISHEEEGVRYEREMFVSYPDRILCFHIKSSKPGAMRLDIMLNRYPFTDKKLPDDRRPGKFVSAGVWASTRCDRLYSEKGNRIMMEGQEAKTCFAAGLVVQTDGRIEDGYSRLVVQDAGEVTIYVAAATDNRTPDFQDAVRQTLDAAEQKQYAQIREDHRKDFSSYMKRCSLALEEDKKASLYFQYGRYLLLSAGREKSAAMNLQGIWNQQFEPSWDSKYTVNINLQMNYWPVESCNLTELHQPFFDLLHKMEKSGRDYAKRMYGCRGMMCHHNVDFYGDCGTQDMYAAATFWPTGAAWLGMHIWEHYLYTLDKEFLKKEYPLLCDIALFFVDFLIEDPEGYLVTCPAVSPENRFITEDGADTPLCAGPAMDNQMIRAIMQVCLEAAEVLGVSCEQEEAFCNVISRLRPNQIDSAGRLMEWAKEEKELTPGMGHISHLWAVYPGKEINWKETPELLEAAKKSLQVRLENGARPFGWPGAWYISIFARCLDGEQADRIIHGMLYEHLTRSMLNARTVFQIDGNLGLLSGMAECLLQSHMGLHFLPALPVSWKNGCVKGLKARGNVTVDLAWKEGKLAMAKLTAAAGGKQQILGEAPREILVDGKAAAWEANGNGFVLDLEKGKDYLLNYC